MERPFAQSFGQICHPLIELFVVYKARVRLVYLEVPYTRLEIPAVWEAHEVVYEVST